MAFPNPPKKLGLKDNDNVKELLQVSNSFEALRNPSECRVGLANDAPTKLQKQSSVTTVRGTQFSKVNHKKKIPT